MRNNKILIVFLLACILSFFYPIKKVSAIAMTNSQSVVNTFTISNTATVTYKYTFVDLNGNRTQLQADTTTTEFNGTVIDLQAIQLNQTA